MTIGGDWPQLGAKFGQSNLSSRAWFCPNVVSYHFAFMWKKIFAIGVADHLPSYIKAKIRLTNQLLVFVVVACSTIVMRVSSLTP
jgi:hypothetical protein